MHHAQRRNHRVSPHDAAARLDQSISPSAAQLRESASLCWLVARLPGWLGQQQLLLCCFRLVVAWWCEQLLTWAELGCDDEQRGGVFVVVSVSVPVLRLVGKGRYVVVEQAAGQSRHGSQHLHGSLFASHLCIRLDRRVRVRTAFLS